MSVSGQLASYSIVPVKSGLTGRALVRNLALIGSKRDFCPLFDLVSVFAGTICKIRLSLPYVNSNGHRAIYIIAVFKKYGGIICTISFLRASAVIAASCINS